MIRVPLPAKTSSKTAVNLLSRSRMRNLDWPARSPRSMSRLRACWTASIMLATVQVTHPNRVFERHRIRAGELAGIRYDAGDPRRSDVDLWQREITVRGKGGRAQVVRIGHEAARALDRYLRVRSKHGQALGAELWLGAGNRGR
jgi:hypothetical protein